MGKLNDWSTTDANNNATPPDGWPENMDYSEVNDTGRAVQGTVRRFFGDINGSLVAGGSADAYTLTLNEGYTAYFAGMYFACKINTANTGATTMNVNSIGAISVLNMDGNALDGDEIEAGGVYVFRHDGTNLYMMRGNSFTETEKTKLGNIVEPLVAIKSADESVTSSIVLQDDDDLVLTLAADTAYKVQVQFVFQNPSATPGYRFQLVLADGTYEGIHMRETLGSTGELFRWTDGFSQSAGALAANFQRIIYFDILVLTGATGGDLKVQWAQNVSDANATVVKADGYMIANKVADI